MLLDRLVYFRRQGRRRCLFLFENSRRSPGRLFSKLLYDTRCNLGKHQFHHPSSLSRSIYVFGDNLNKFIKRFPHILHLFTVDLYQVIVINSLIFKKVLCIYLCSTIFPQFSSKLINTLSKVRCIF